jgi:hypothetical protein
MRKRDIPKVDFSSPCRRRSLYSNIVEFSIRPDGVGFFGDYRE